MNSAAIDRVATILRGQRVWALGTKTSFDCSMEPKLADRNAAPAPSCKPLVMLAKQVIRNSRGRRADADV